MKDLPWTLVLALLLALAVAWGVREYRQHQEAVQRADSLDAVRAVERRAREALQVRVLEQDSVAQADSLELLKARALEDSLQAEVERQGEEAERQAAEAGRNLRASLDSLRRSVRDELSPVVDTALVQYERLRSAQQLAIVAFRNQAESVARVLGQTEAALTSERQRVQSRDSVIAALEEELRLAGEEIAEVRSALPGGFFGRLRIGAVPAVIGLGLGLAVGAAVR